MSDSSAGFQRDVFSNTDFLAHSFLIRALLTRVRTAMLVRVTAVTNAGTLAAVGTVDVTPLVNQVDGQGNTLPHGTIYHCPYVRVQGGANAVILDPQINDIGIAVFADRDISSVIAAKAASNPGSRRMHDMADGLYVGGCLNGVPTQYVQFNASGITVTSPNLVTVNAPSIALAGNVATTGTLTNNGVNVGSTHAHNGVTTGTGNTGVPH